MNADDLRPIVLVVLAVAALGAAAATLDAGQGPRGTPDVPNRSADAPGTPIAGAGEGVSLPALECPAPISDDRLFGGLVVGVLLLGGLAYRVRGSIFVPIVVGGPVLVGLVSLCGSPLPLGSPVPTAFVSSLPSTPVLLGILLAAVGGAVALLYYVTAADERLEPEPTEGEPGVDLSAVGRAAGAAADRIERQADVTNEVYRAWLEMTRHLDVENAAATTPEEFAGAAIEAGMAREDVTTLTRLFEEVRYGGLDPASREEQAVSALRSIERAYASDRS